MKKIPNSVKIILPLQILKYDCSCAHDNQFEKHPTRVLVNHNGKKGMIAIDQTRTVDKTRILKVIEKLSDKEIIKCKDVIREAFVD